MCVCFQETHSKVGLGQKDGWTEEEDSVLIRAHKMMGNCWSEIVKCLPGRTENSVKNHWNTTKRRQLSRRPYRNTRNSYNSQLLLNYIRSLNLSDDQDLNLNSSFLNTRAVDNDPKESAEVEVEVEAQRPTSVEDIEFDYSLLPDFADVYSIEDVLGNDFLNDDFLLDGLEWDQLGTDGTNNNLNLVNAATQPNPESYADIDAAAATQPNPESYADIDAAVTQPNPESYADIDAAATQPTPESYADINAAAVYSVQFANIDMKINHPIPPLTDEEDIDLMEMNSVSTA